MSDYDASKVHIQWAKEMATWRNGDAKLEAADLVLSDPYLNFSLFEPVGIGAIMGRADSYIPHWRTKEYSVGFFGESYYLNSGRLLYPFFGKCATTEATPNIHAISKRTTQTPLNHGRHLEIENDTGAEAERIDILGMLPSTYLCGCMESNTKAVQSALWNCAFTKSTGTDDIAEPARPSEDPFDWTGITFPTFTYNSETLEADIMGWSFSVRNNVFWRGLDSTGRYTIGKMGNFKDISVTLNIIPTGKNMKELIRTALESYATDLDLTVKLARSATDYIQWTHDKMYCMPFDIIPPSRNKWFEGYLITLHQLGTGSLAIEVKDAYNNDYYENP